MGKRFTARRVAAKYGFRSGLETIIDTKLKEEQVSSEYEKHSINYIKPATNHKYTPDFKITNSAGQIIYLESKGRWVLADRQKMKLIKEQYPELDIRIIFQNPDMKISKKSKTTYGQIATKLGYTWCDYRQGIPAEWLQEFR
jgi:hypothetical protein